jgi:regulatory protein YycH of two-component signal transduction system YycFG
MAKITWIGEDEIHDGAAGPSFTTAFGGIKFPKAIPIDVFDKDIVARAAGNPYFSIDDGVVDADIIEDEPPAKRRPGRPRKDETANVQD